jgi:hypothetical protein
MDEQPQRRPGGLLGHLSSIGSSLKNVVESAGELLRDHDLRK